MGGVPRTRYRLNAAAPEISVIKAGDVIEAHERLVLPVNYRERPSIRLSQLPFVDPMPG